MIGLILAAIGSAWILGARSGLPRFARPSSRTAEVSESLSPVRPSTIRGQGKLIPASGLINIVAAPGERVDKIVDKQSGDEVGLGEILVTLHSRVLRESDLKLAKARRVDALKNAQYEKQQAAFRLKSAQLALEEANASDKKIAEQANAIRLLQRQLNVAQALFQRLQKLKSNPATTSLVNQTDIERQELLVEQLRFQIEQAETEGEMAKRSAVRAKEVAQNNLNTVEFSIENADDATPVQSLDAAVTLAQQACDLTQIRSPIQHGTILDVIVHEGDSVTNQPIMVLADLSQMNCEVEVVDSFLGMIDLQKHKNLRARITGNALDAPLLGTVIAKGVMIGPVSLMPPNPFAKVDQRTGVITVKLDESETAARFVNLQVDVEIEVEPGALLMDDRRPPGLD